MMIAKTLTLLAAVGVAIGSKRLEGVDPNSLSCDSTGQEFLLLPHFTDCTKFFMCSHGVEVEFSCSGKLIFDFALQGCNWESEAECILRDVEEVIGGSGEGSGDGLEWTEDSLASGDARKASAYVPDEHTAYFSDTVLNCQRIEDATRQVVYKGDCQRYWRCVDGVPHTLYCSDGLFFNEKTQQCDFEANVRCNVETVDELTGEYMVYN